MCGSTNNWQEETQSPRYQRGKETPEEGQHGSKEKKRTGATWEDDEQEAQELTVVGGPLPAPERSHSR
jgi:hypothetical protein